MDKTGFITYLEAKNLSITSIDCYVKLVNCFFRHTKKEDIQVTKPDILNYLEYLKNSRQQQNITRRNSLIALNHYFTYLYEDEQITANPCLFLKIRGAKRKMLYKIYSSEELDQVFDTYYQLFVRNFDDSCMPKRNRERSALSKERNALILSILVYQGTVTGEIDRIELDDLDLIKATIKIRGSKRHNERVLPLKATQIGLFIHYLQHARPQLLAYHTAESNKLFLTLPEFSKKSTDKDSLLMIFKRLSKQLKTIDKQFFNFKQLRASVITFWLKTQGLRKTQYLAGHKWISSTEEYLPNNLDDLTDDINKLHPF